MTLKKMIGAGLVAASGAFAQYSFEPTAPAATSAPESKPAPAAQSSTAPIAAGVFDQLRGNAYGVIPNEAAASTVGGNLDKPHNFGGQQLLYVEPADERGVVSFGKSTTYILGLDNSNDLGLLTLGLANKDSWGLALNVALGKTWTSRKVDETASNTAVEQGDLIGLAFSMPMGGNVLAAKADWYTHTDELSTDNGDVETVSDYTDLAFDINFGNGPSAKELFWTAGLNVLRHSESVEQGSKVAIEADTRTEVTLYVNAGQKVLGNDRARVLLGANNALITQLFDDVKDEWSGHTEIGLMISPNILGELAITNNWLVFGGATHNILLGSYLGYTLGSGENKVDYTAIQMHSYPTVATAGVRYQKDNFAAEACLSDNVFTNGVSEIFQGNGTLISFGAFLYF